MKISYDAAVECFQNSEWSDRDKRHVRYSREGSGRALREGAEIQGRLAGLEILDAQKRFGGADTMRRVELEGVGS